MSRRVFWNLTIAVIGLLGSTGGAPVLARGGHGPGAYAASSRIFAGGPRIPNARGEAVGRIAANRIDRDGPRRGDLTNGAAILGWPYYPGFEATPLDDGDAQPVPQIIAVSGGPAAAAPRTALDTPSDYSFVAGCRPIPNGYHCDPPGHPATTQ